MAALAAVIAHQDKYNAVLGNEIASQTGNAPDESLETPWQSFPNQVPKTPPPDEDTPTIVVVARTHLQVKHIISELKGGPPEWRRRMTVLRARKRTCLNLEVRDGARPDTACKDACADDSCPFRNRANMQRLKAALDSRSSAWDIEDLMSAAHQHRACAYFSAQELSSDSQLVFATHQHIASECLDLDDAVVLIDEGHRLSETIRDAASGVLRVTTLHNAAATISLLAEQPESEVRALALDVDRTALLAQQLARLAQWARQTAGEAASLPDKHWPPTPRCIEMEYWLGSMVGLEDPISFSTELTLFSSMLTEQGSLSVALRRLVPPDQRAVTQELARLLNGMRRYPKAYNMAVLATLKTPTLLLTCVDASEILAHQLEAAASTVVMTGTCTDPARLSADLGIAFQHVLQTPHHVPPRQAAALTVTEALGQPVRLVAAQFTKPAVADWIGRMVAKAAGASCNRHGAVAVYFPSQAAMMSVLERWTDPIAWPTPVWECLVRGDMPDAYEELTRAVARGPPYPVLCATARGRLAEGIDLKDELCRVLILLGLPLKDSRHPAVSSRLAFLEAQGYPRKTQLVDEALVNVNQTIGRGLRSAGDYCVFILCDERYATQRVRHGLTAVPHNGHPRLLMPFDAAEVEAQVASHLAKFLPEQPHSPDLL